MGKNDVDCANCPDRGMCCRYVVLPLARPLTADEKNWVELHMTLDILESASGGEGQNVKIGDTCIALEQDGRCSLYNSSQRPQICDVWPDDPDNQAPPGCLYRRN